MAGSALIIVLSFVVLLTVVVLAMLSHSLLNRMISNASSNVTKTDLYAHGAIDQIIGDLRQEVVAGSTSSGSGTSTIYRPSSVAASVPYNSGPSSYTTAIWNQTFPNLVKESTHGVSFEPYDSPTPRAAPVSTTSLSVDGSSRIISGSADGTSLNGHYVSVTRWNKPLLLPKALAGYVPGTGGSPTTFTDTGTTTSAVAQPTPVSSFVAPDWILTTANSSNPNPTTWPASPATTIENPKSTSYVVGRYAYTIYNEGGLLDANVAGGPWATTGTPPTSAIDGLIASQLALYYRKGPSAFADLSQLPGLADLTTLEGATNYRGQYIVDSLVGWRNAASAASSPNLQTSPFPTYKFSFSGDVNIGNYLNYLLGLSSNFMSTGYTGTYNTSTNPPGYPDSYSGQIVTDQVFTGRQQMINFFENTIAKSIGTTAKATEQAYLQDAMMYLGTFSRTLNQPSYWPDPTRPTIQPLGTYSSYTGGNDVNVIDATGNTNNPIFRSIRVGSTGFTRFDGTPANPGDPLVKKRFPLNRLAWLTYKGPSNDVNGTGQNDSVVNQTISALGGNPTSSTDPITQYVNNTGTDANIYQCFGLTWYSSYQDPITGVTSSLWVYNHTSNSTTPPANPLTSGSPTNPIIMTLSQVAAQNRDPDFIELLKAAICAGSLGKGSQLNGLGGSAQYQFALDTTTDYQILQIAANIIEQFKPDGFPVRIEDPASVTVGGATIPPWVACGSENLPYIAGLGAIALQIYPYAPNPLTASAPTDSGAGVMLGLPILWNPYDQNCPTPSYNPTLSSTALSGQAPTSFQFFAQANNTSTSNSVSAASFNTRADGPSGINSSGNFSDSNTTYLTYPTTVMNFVVPPGNNTLFREPTFLDETTKPTSSLLALGPITGTNTNAINTSPYVTNTQDPAAGNLSNSSGFTEYMASSRHWIGIYCGQFPLAFTASGIPYQTTQGSNTNAWATLLLGLQCKDGLGNLITYDQTYISPPVYDAGLTPTKQAVWGGNNNNIDEYTLTLMDPRTSRFGCAGGGGYQQNIAEVDPTNHIIYSDRPDATNGSAYGVGPTPVIPGTGSSTGWTGSSNYLGLFCQNNVTVGTYYADPDGVVRRAMGAYASTALTTAASPSGLPMAMAYSSKGSLPSSKAQGESRPWMLHRPFRSVAELGYVFRGTPWKNLDFFTPESGDSALLDTFCINEDYRPDAVAAGRVDLNSKQAPVFQALLAGAYRDETAGLKSAPTTVVTSTLGGATGFPQVSLTSAEAIAISQALVTRTTVGGTNAAVSLTTPQPLSNIGDIVGRWISGTSTATATTTGINGATSYDGFSADLGTGLATGAGTTATGLYSTSGSGVVTPDDNVIQRLRESTMRALSDAGQAGTWNLLIDVVAQSGHYPNSATSLSNFLVEGERRYWVHVSIDRQTGQVVDENIEPVNE